FRQPSTLHISGGQLWLTIPAKWGLRPRRWLVDRIKRVDVFTRELPFMACEIQFRIRPFRTITLRGRIPQGLEPWQITNRIGRSLEGNFVADDHGGTIIKPAHELAKP